MLYKRAGKRNVCFFPNKTTYVVTAAYKVGGCYIGGELHLANTEPDFSGSFECS